MNNKHYIYKHLNKTTGEVFYIGIGVNSNGNFDRSKTNLSRNKYWKEYVLNNKGFDVEIILQNISKETACSLEKDFIKKYGRICNNTGVLTNISIGGQNGLFGIPRTKEHNDKIRNAQKGRKKTPEQIKVMSDRMKGRVSGNKGKKASEETRKKLSVAAKGRIGYWTGKKRSEEDKIKMGLSKKGKPSKKKGIKVSEEVKLKSSATWFKKGQIPHNKKVL